jgi:HD-GYP domain-containing protein (c-di-GMP phosphodiesterase class II)
VIIIFYLEERVKKVPQPKPLLALPDKTGQDAELCELKRKVEHYQELMNFSESIFVPSSYEDLEKRIKSKTKKLVQCEHVFVYRYSEIDKALYRGDSINIVRANSPIIPVDQESIEGSCAYHGALLHIVDAKSDIRFKRSRYTGNIDCRNMLLVPLFSQGSVAGIIQAINSKTPTFTDEDIYLLKVLSNQLASVMENHGLFEKVHNQFFQICYALSEAIIKKDTYTGGHTKRVTVFSEMIAKELPLTFQEMRDLKLAAVLHDIGKIGIEDRILKKQFRLNQEEFEIMKQHPRLGGEILGHVKGLDSIVEGVMYHHERPDGKGYPYGIKEDKIPMIAQIISVADSFDAMISNRPYRRGLPPMEAYQEIIAHAGTQFVASVVDGFERAFKKSHMYQSGQQKRYKQAA